MIKRIKHIIRDMYFWYLSRVNPRKFVDVLYVRGFHRHINLDHPKDINEKINWLKLYSDTTRWTELADKYKVREFIKEKGYEDTLVTLYGKWDRVEQIDWTLLPNTFVMKTNHGCGDIFVCSDKSQLDVRKCARYFKKQLKHKIGYEMAEFHYNRIPPCIIAEEYLDAKQQQIQSSSLIDYKVWAFNGNASYIMVCANRKPGSLELGVYDKEWNYHPEYTVHSTHYPPLSQKFPVPGTLHRMLEMAASMSEGFPQVRVDFYELNGHLYFGEMTFSSAGGMMDYYSDEFLNILGDLCILPASNQSSITQS